VGHEALDIFGLWLAALLTFCIASFLYRDNPVYKVAEHIYLGVALGYGLTLQVWDNLKPQAWDPLYNAVHHAEGGSWLTLIPVVLGLFILVQPVQKFSWLSRYSFAVYIGGAVGTVVPTVIAGSFMPLLVDAFAPLHGGAGLVLDLVVIFVATFCTLLYFFFSLEHKGAIGSISRVGVVFLMISFGASFGNTVMARVSLLIGRVQFLLEDWIGKGILGHH
jgi:hypothetical protein